MNEAVPERDNLPKGWINLELQNCVKILDSKRIPVNTSQREQRRGIVPYYGSTGQVGWIDDHLFDEELVLLGEDGAPFFDNFKDTAYLISGKSWVNNHAHVLKGIKNLLLNKFLCYFLNQFDYHEYVTGTTRLKLNQTRMKVIPVLLPPLAEQKRIVSKIESIFAQIDGTRTRLEVASRMLNKLRSSVLRQAFGGKLVPQDPNDAPAEATLKKIHRDSEKELVFEKDNLPNGWILVKIDYICKLIGGGTPSRKNLDYFNGDIVWLTPTEISKNSIQKIYDSKEKITKLGLEKSSARVIPINSVLLTTRASIGYVAIAGTNTSTNQGFASFSCNGTMFNYYLAYWLWSKKNFLKSEATGTTFKEISKSKLREIQIPLPPLAEQKRIVSKIESIFTRIDAVERYIESTLRLLDLLKSSTLKQAFEGKLVSQNPDDEPVEFLLQIMKQEKQLIKSQKSSYGRKNVR